jgi:WD40 repeat protein
MELRGKLLAFLVVLQICLDVSAEIDWIQGGHTREIAEIAVTLDNTRIATACGDGVVKLWDLTNGLVRQTLIGNTNPIRAMVYSRDGESVVAALDNGEVVLWRPGTGSGVQRTWAPHVSTSALNLSADGRLLATGSAEGAASTLKIWSIPEGELVRTLQGQTSSVVTVTFNHDAGTVISTTREGVIREWDVESGTLMRKINTAIPISTATFVHSAWELVIPGATMFHAYFLPSWTRGNAPTDGRRVSRLTAALQTPYIAGGTADGNLVWDFGLTGGSVFKVIAPGEGDLRSLAIHSEGPPPQGGVRIFTGTSTGVVKDWNLEGHLVRRIGYLESAVRVIRFNARGDRIVLGGKNGLHLFHPGDGSFLGSMLHTNVSDAAFSPDGTLLVTADMDKKVRLWRTADQFMVRAMSFHTAPVNAIAYAPGGQQFASGSADKTIRVWNNNSSAPARTMTGSGSAIERIAYTIDGGTILSGDATGVVAWWRTSDGQQTNFVQAHDHPISDLKVSRDGRLLATCAVGASELKVWRLSDGMLLRTIAEEVPIVSCAFSPSGGEVAGALRDVLNGWNSGEVRAWRLADGALLQRATNELQRVDRLDWASNGALAAGRLDAVALKFTLPPPLPKAPALGVRLGQNSARLTFTVTGEKGRVVQVQGTTNFVQWRNWTNIVGTGSEHALEYPISGGKAGFFRALID